jgi:hypothetical protein
LAPDCLFWEALRSARNKQGCAGRSLLELGAPCAIKSGPHSKMPAGPSPGSVAVNTLQNLGHTNKDMLRTMPRDMCKEQTLDSSQNQIQDEQNRVMLNRQQCTHNNSTNEVYTIIRYILASTYTTCVCFCCPLRNNSANKPERIHQLESNLPGNTHRCLVGHQVYETCTSGALPEA